ncbi:MAG: DUF6438 domain-containing protein [Hyphomonadaceae bacterium]
MRSLVVLLVLIASSACATAQAPPAADAFVKLEEGGCGYIASCPAYVITLKPDGSYHFQGYKNVAVIGVRDGKLASGAWADAETAFAAAGWTTLEDPTSRGGGIPCMADSPFARITRHVREGEEKVFSYNLGCDSEAGGTLLDALKYLMPVPAA